MDRFAAAVDYYANVLRKGGPGFEFPIRRLTGHRRQAPGHIQNVAKGEAELAAFLAKYPSIFRIKDNNVMLCKYWNDDCNTKTAVEYYSSVLKRLSPSGLPINRLFGHRSQAPIDIFQVVKNPLELRAFLLEHPETFRMENNDVFLNNTVGLKETLDTSNNLNSVSSDVSNSDTSAVHYYSNVLKKISPDMKFPISRLIGYRGQATHDIQGIAKTARDLYNFLSNHPEMFVVTEDDCVLLKCSEMNESFSEKSENDAVQFYTKILRDKGISKEAPIPIKLLICCRSKASRNVQNCARNEEELLALLSSHPSIFKVQDGFIYLAADRKQNKIKNDDRYYPPINNKNITSQNTIDWKSHVLNNTNIVEDIDECIHVCKVIQKENVIALDCEGYNLGHGIISIIQIGLANGQIYLFDIREDRNMVYHGGLKEILESDNIVKVTNLCRNDSINLKLQFGVALKNVFDVSVAYHVIEYGILTMSNFKSVGFNQICSKYGAPENTCKDEMKNVYRTEPDYWLRRPLTDRMIAYAALDVASLVPCLYEELLKRLDERTECAVWSLSQKLCEM